ncbi:hypothetical protein [Neisseria sicca]|nr:hypothetical protein [Neisseria sicca]
MRPFFRRDAKEGRLKTCLLRFSDDLPQSETEAKSVTIAVLF